MDFIVYDNIITFNRHIPFNGNSNTRLEVTSAYLTERGSFWFDTDFDKEESNVNIHRAYVHIHPGIISMNQSQFDKPPFPITKENMKYNPKTKHLEIRKSILPFTKPLWKKRVKYYGSKLPNGKMSVLGTWFFNYYNDAIYFILNYFPEYSLKFVYEEDTSYEEKRVAELESLIQLKEDQLKLSSADTSAEN